MDKHYDVFISYSRKDYVDENKNIIPGNVVSALKSLLQENQITYWFDEDGIYSGDTFAEKIASNIEKASVLLFISSESSNASKWTSKEIAAASMWKKTIIPVRIDHSPYNRSVMLYIADLDFVDYPANPEKAKGVIVESIKNQIAEEKQAVEREKRAEEQAREMHRQQQESLYREITERIVRYNTEQKILQTSCLAIYRVIDRIEDESRQDELKQMLVIPDKSSSVDNVEIATLRKRNRLLEIENEKLKAGQAGIRMKSERCQTHETGVVDASNGRHNTFRELFKEPLKYWFTFNGTVNRRVFAIAHGFLLFILLVLSGLLGGYAFVVIPMGFVCSLSFCVRRCRDVGREWYYLLIPFYVFVLLFEKGNEVG